MVDPVKTRGVGAAIPRKEDDRLMRGRGRFVGDMTFPGQLEVAFFRSPVAHGRIRSIDIPDDLEGLAFHAGHLAGVKGILAKSGLPGFRVSEQPVLAVDKVRFVGEPIVACIGRDRAEAEDRAGRISVEIDELPANVDPLASAEVTESEPEKLIHAHWPDNLFLQTQVEGDLTSARERADISVHLNVSTGRQSMNPLEGKGTVALWDRHVEQLVLYTSTQMPHIVRTGLSECLGLNQRQVRIIAPDVGGGFGWKGLLQPEEVVLGWLTTRLDRPVRWTEDRREHLIAAANCREHVYDLTAYATKDGKLLALDAVAHVDAGAYSVYPFSACLEAAQVGSILPGPYDFEAFRCKTYSVCSNKPPLVPYRGVARTGVCFAMELVMDAIAEKAGMEPHEVRLKNLVQPDQMPFKNITGKDFDSGDYPESLRRAAKAIDVAAVRRRQEAGEPDGRRIGLGFAVYCEQGAHGTSVYHGWGIPMVPGHEQCKARLTPDGVLELFIGSQSHGQSMETTLAQVAQQELGLDLDRIHLVHGDTGQSPYSTGTWGSRSAVMAGGAVSEACKALSDRIIRIGAHLLQADAKVVRIEGGRVVTQEGASIDIADVAHCWYMAPQNLPQDADPAGLEVTAGYKAKVDTGTFSYASHACVVAVDPEIGKVEILDYVIVEDGGVLLNPHVVEGQIWGGLAQGIGTALYEEMTYDSAGQPLASTLADYVLPGANEVPNAPIEHMETPSPNTAYGQKGIGEGGAIAPPAVITNAINDALKAFGVRLTQSPVTPRRILEALMDRDQEADQP
ncbi:MAG: xanthine dehydrogenase family protein molybdopterin-binding subunit [Magnetovibrionaceae bacterium]